MTLELIESVLNRIAELIERVLNRIAMLVLNISYRFCLPYDIICVCVCVCVCSYYSMGFITQRAT